MKVLQFARAIRENPVPAVVNRVRVSGIISVTSLGLEERLGDTRVSSSREVSSTDA